MSARAKIRAVVLRILDYGEADRVVTLLSEERGKLAAFARGARASRRRFGGALELFTLLDAEVKERPGSDLATLESVNVVRAFGAIRGDLARIACAGYACELASELVRDSEPHPDLVALLEDYLGLLDAGPARPAALRAFELGALRAAGLMPRLGACARCGEAISFASESERLRFDPAQGGFLCRRCAPSAPGSREALGATALALTALQSGGLAAAGEEPPPAVAAEARDVLTSFIEHHLGRRLAARKFLDEVGPALGK